MWHPQLLVGSPAAPGTTRLHAPSEWKTLSNGILTDTRIEGNQRIDTWISEVPAARSFAAGPYTVREFSFGSRTYGVYLLSADDAKAKTYGQGMAKVLEALEARFGPYPYESCSIVEIPEHAAAWRGASEHGFVVAASSELPEGSFNLTLIAHELAHQWWGNFVGSRNPAAQMVDEALAEYGVYLAIEASEGEKAAGEFLRMSRPDYVPCTCGGGYFDRGHRHLPDKPLMQLTGEGHDYWLATAKGLWVYHMLRVRVGDELFFGTLRQLIDRHGGDEMSLHDLRAAFMEAAPPDIHLEVFFQQWLDRPGAPGLDVVWADASSTEQSSASVDIRQAGERYELQVEIAVDSDNATEHHTVQLTGGEQNFLLHARGIVTGVRIDPNQQLLLRDGDSAK
jgi:aminopeptidase N